VRDVPAWISWIRYLSFVYWGNNLLMRVEYSGVTLRDCTSQALTGSCTDVTGSSLQVRCRCVTLGRGCVACVCACPRASI
jgi:hypothetical protein